MTAMLKSKETIYQTDTTHIQRLKIIRSLKTKHIFISNHQSSLLLVEVVGIQIKGGEK